MTFSLKNQHCKMGRINNGLEKRGEQEVIAFDLPLSTEIKKGKINQLLGEYADRALFNTDNDVERPLDLFEKCEPLALIERFAEAEVLIQIERKSYTFEDCQISKITVMPMTGGTAQLEFSLRVRPSTDEEICRLLEWQNLTVIVDVTSAKLAAKKSLRQQELGLKLADEDRDETTNGKDAALGEFEQRAH